MENRTKTIFKVLLALSGISIFISLIYQNWYAVLLFVVLGFIFIGILMLPEEPTDSLLKTRNKESKKETELKKRNIERKKRSRNKKNIEANATSNQQPEAPKEEIIDEVETNIGTAAVEEREVKE